MKKMRLLVNVLPLAVFMAIPSALPDSALHNLPIV